MDRHTKQTNSTSDLKLPSVGTFLEFFISVVNKDQIDQKDKSGLAVVDRSKLVKAESKNFTVYGPSLKEAEAIALCAEDSLKIITKDWYRNKEINWPKKVEIVANVNSHLGSGGNTTTTSDLKGKLLSANTRIQGSPERLFDSVIPHEVSHMLVADYFPKSLIRWANEGIAISLESREEQIKLEELISSDFERTKEGRASSLETFDKILVMMDYPIEKRKELEFYAKAMSLTEFLIDNGGKAHFIEFLKEANPEQTKLETWNKVLKKYYKIDGSEKLESKWREWVKAKIKD